MYMAKQVRRALIVSRKRMNLFKYNFNLKMSGSFGVEHDMELMSSYRSMNLLDFDANAEQELYLCDVHSD